MKRLIASTALTLTLAPAALAEKEPHADIYFAASTNGRLFTAGWDHDTDTIISADQRVFEGELGLDPMFPFSGDEPGIGSNLIGTTLSLNLLGGLGAWNGAGYTTSTSGIMVSYGGQDAYSTVGGSVSFLVSQDLHLHPAFTLFGAGGADPANGIYIAAFTVSSSAYAASETFWIVFNLGMSEADHEAAVDWANANLVPGPGGLALLAFAGITSARSRTRRR
jgi:hypothetical protein